MMLRNREGFTLIELLIVVVIIGILAAIALPKFGQTRERAYMSAMQSDLRNLQTAQEMYYNDNYVYATAIGTGADELNFTTSAPVSIALAAVAGPPVGYTATATHTALAGENCVLTVGGTGAQGIVCTSLTD